MRGTRNTCLINDNFSTQHNTSPLQSQQFCIITPATDFRKSPIWHRMPSLYYSNENSAKTCTYTALRCSVSTATFQPSVSIISNSIFSPSARHLRQALIYGVRDAWTGRLSRVTDQSCGTVYRLIYRLPPRRRLPLRTACGLWPRGCP